MNNLLILQATIVNEGVKKIQDILVKKGRIERIDNAITVKEKINTIDAAELHLIPGIIDDQVHFREPGLTHKATIATESAAAVAGGVTSYMEMPNTNPASLTHDLLEQKYQIAAQHSAANYSFYMGVANDNAEAVLTTNKFKKDICGIKIFMGSSTGNMLVDNYVTLNKIFSESELLIATHCENENIIAAQKQKYPDANHASYHPLIRNDEACFESTLAAIQLAKKYDSRLHVLHISTAKELQLFSNFLPLQEKRITNEVCVHHLHFTADDYATFGNLIKCNPAIKAPENKKELWTALLNDTLDIIATDHAPHTWEEKQLTYQNAPSGLPLVQHSLQIMLAYVNQNKISIEKLVEKMCHAPATCFQLKDRGFIREGYWADLVLINQNKSQLITKDNIQYKCGWSPFENHRFSASIEKTIVNGFVAFENEKINAQNFGARLKFDR